MGVKVRQLKGVWWVLVDPKLQRKPKRVSVGEAGKRAAEDVAKSYEVQLALGHFDFSKTSGVTFETYATDWLDTHGRTLKCGRGGVETRSTGHNGLTCRRGEGRDWLTSHSSSPP